MSKKQSTTFIKAIKRAVKRNKLKPSDVTIVGQANGTLYVALGRHHGVGEQFDTAIVFDLTKDELTATFMCKSRSTGFLYETMNKRGEELRRAIRNMCGKCNMSVSSFWDFEKFLNSVY